MVTTDFFASLSAHCERLGLPRDSFRNLVTTDPAGRELYHQVERGELSQPDFKRRCGPSSTQGWHPSRGHHELLGDSPL